MAGSTLLQKLDGGSDFGASTSNRRQVEIFLAEGVITSGDWVSWDVSQTGADKALYIVQTPAEALATDSDGRVVGVALETATGTAVSPASVRVCIAGYVASANVVTGTGVGMELTPTTTAGRLGPAEYIADGSGAVAYSVRATFGVCLTLAAANTAEVMVFKKF
jgi:hypothetical protein